MGDGMVNIAVIGYGTGAVFFAVLALVLMTGRRARAHRLGLLIAALASTVWMASAAWGSPLLVYLLEPLRDLALLSFLAGILSAAYTDPQQAGQRFRRTLGMLSAFALLLISMLLYRVAAGAEVPVVGGVDLLFAGYLVMAVTGMVLVEQLIRNVRRESRRAIKYLCIGLGALFAYDFYLYSHALLFQSVDPALWSARGFINALVVPVLGIAVARDPQWSQDIFVSRRMVFHTAALLGSGIYLLAMGAGGYFIRVYGGTWGTVAEVIFLFGAGLVLLILLFSSQLRARLRVFLNKHFFHYKYEYRDEWLRFIHALTSGEPDERLRERSIRAIADILESPGGLLWLRRDAGCYEPAGSWQMPLPAGDVRLSADSSLVQYFSREDWVINVDEYRRQPGLYKDLTLPDWLERLDGAWLIAPLVFHERLLGLVLLARPQVVPPLNWEDYDLLRTLGRQAAAHLAQLEAAQALAQAQQFEVCSRLSAYVMHDLKNLIAQLSLVVSNAARHKHNPQFMEDAIQTVENSVDKMNRLLAHLRSGGVSDRSVADVDLCEVLRDAVQTMSAGLPRPKLDCQAIGLQARADRDRLTAVIGHIIRNAQDATPDDGLVIVRIFKQHEQAVIEVQDNGTGMDEDFIRERLFKPFDTTKGATGMGIGVYETREFIRAMGGEVTVLSRLGEGTTFRLSVPISNESKNSVKFADTADDGTIDDNKYKEIAGY